MKQFFPRLLYDQITSEPYFWNINNISIKEDNLLITGWALPFDGKVGNVSLFVDNLEQGDLSFEIAEGVVKSIPWWPNSMFSGFLASVPISKIPQIKKSEMLSFSVAPLHSDSSIKTAISGNEFSRTFCYQHNYPATVPGEELSKTIGSTNAFQFRLFGCTLKEGLDVVVQKHTGGKFSSLDHVLDLGVRTWTYLCTCRSSRFTTKKANRC